MTVLKSGCFSLRYCTTKSYMPGSSGVLRNAQGESLASPNLVAMSVKKRSWRPVSDRSSSFFWSVPNTGSATDEQPGPNEKSTLSTVARRLTTASPCSATHASSCEYSASFTRLPPTTSPPASLISSTARLARPNAALPKKEAGPLSGHMPPILTVPSLWNAATPPGRTSRMTSSTTVPVTPRRFIMSLLGDPFAFDRTRCAFPLLTPPLSPVSSRRLEHQDGLGFRLSTHPVEVLDSHQAPGAKRRESRHRPAAAQLRLGVDLHPSPLALLRVGDHEEPPRGLDRPPAPDHEPLLVRATGVGRQEDDDQPQARPRRRNAAHRGGSTTMVFTTPSVPTTS